MKTAQKPIFHEMSCVTNPSASKVGIERADKNHFETTFEPIFEFMLNLEFETNFFTPKY